MSDPPRLLEDTSEELSDSMRRLLVAGMSAAPPSELGAQVWAGLATKLPGPGAGPGAAQGAGGGAHVGGLLFKAALAVVGLGALVLGGRALLQKDAPVSQPPKPVLSSVPVLASAPSPTTHVVDVAPPPAPLAVAPAAPARVTSVVHSGKQAVTHAPPAPASSLSSDASEESRLVAAARDALRSGNSAGALTLLGQAQQRFGAGVLGQEREALTIEALSKSGQRALAQARGQAFLKSYANSPYSARIRAIVGAN